MKTVAILLLWVSISWAATPPPKDMEIKPVTVSAVAVFPQDGQIAPPDATRTPCISVPPGKEGIYFVYMVLTDADRTNTATEIYMALELFDGVQRTLHTFVRYKGGVFLKNGVPVNVAPGFYVDATRFRNKQVCLAVAPRTTMLIGLTIETILK